MVYFPSSEPDSGVYPPGLHHNNAEKEKDKMTVRNAVTTDERVEEKRAWRRSTLIASIMIAMFIGGVWALIPTHKHIATSRTSTVLVDAKTTTPQTITVQKGDTLSAIREKHRPYMDEELFEVIVCATNNLPNPDGLRVGTELTLPPKNTDNL